MIRRGLMGATAVALLAGGAAVYLVAGPGGNAALAEPVELAAGVVETPACMLDDATFDTLEEATKGQVAAMQPMKRGLDLSTLSFLDAEGERLTIADLGDGTKLLNLWATWCAPCRAEMPELDALAAEGAESGAYTVVGLSVDAGDSLKPRQFLDELGIENLPLYHDNSMGAFLGMRVAGLGQGLPITALLDGKGCVLAAMAGPAAWHSEDARELMAVASSL